MEGYGFEVTKDDHKIKASTPTSTSATKPMRPLLTGSQTNSRRYDTRLREKTRSTSTVTKQKELPGASTATQAEVSSMSTAVKTKQRLFSINVQGGSKDTIIKYFCLKDCFLDKSDFFWEENSSPISPASLVEEASREDIHVTSPQDEDESVIRGYKKIGSEQKVMLVFVEGSGRRSANIRYNRLHPLRLFHQNQRMLARKFRMQERHIKKICRVISPIMGGRQTSNWSVDLENKVVIALRYLATNAHQEVLADTMGVSQKTVSNAVREVVHVLNNPLIVRHFIRCRLADEEYCRSCAAAFARTGPFPNIIGAVDGSCIPLQKPPHFGWQYYCRKGFTALNVLAAVDAHGRFVYINANFPGSVHDASVYSASQVKYAYEEGSVPHGYSFIGDSGFANGNDIITPIRNPRTRQEVSYNRWHSKMRVIVECTFGVWKRKFAILKDKIRVAPKRAAKIIIACAVLYNMMMAMGCLRPRLLGRRLAVCRHPPQNCADIRGYLVSCM